MNEIKQIESNVIMIFPTDSIHLMSIKRNDSKDQLSKKYKLKGLISPSNIPIPPNLEVFREGEFVYKGRVYPIDEIIIEERRMIIRMSAPSEINVEFFKNFRKDLIELDVREYKSDYTPLLTTYETVCVCRLEMDFKKFYNPLLIDAMYGSIDALIPHYESEHEIIPNMIKFRLEYFNLSDKIRKEKMALSDKYIIIEERGKTNPEDKVFFTTSPTETRVHLQILDEIEKAIK